MPDLEKAASPVGRNRLRTVRSGDWSIGRRPVVLLHGLGSSADDWPLQLPALSEWPVLAMDLPGHGHSGTLQMGASMADLADEVEAALGRAVDSPVHLVGVSLGAAVALELALKRPERVASLVLASGFARLRPRPVGLFTGAIRLFLLLIGRMDWLGRWVARTLFPKPDQAEIRALAADRIAANDRNSYLATIWAVARFDVLGALPRISVPTLVIAGEQDQVVPLQAKLALAHGIDGARLVRLPDAGHAAPIDDSQAFNAALLEFLEALAPGKPQMRQVAS